MSISKNAVKSFVSAALAVVVSGLVVGVSAAPVTNQLTTHKQGQMDVSYEVTMKAEMEVTNKSLSGNALLEADPSVMGNAGNLGSIKVTTNYPHWDVEVQAFNSLRLESGSTSTPNPDGPFGPVPPTITAGVPLKKGKGVGDTLYLYVQIGILGSGAYETGTLTDFTDSLKSQPKVSLAFMIGEKLGTNTLALTGDQQGAAAPGAAIAGDIAHDGFATPTTADESITFLVAAGLTPPGGTAPKPTNNKDGIYTETLEFTLVAGY